MRPRIRIAEPEDFSPGALALIEEVAEVVAEPVGEGGLAEALAGCDVFWFRLGHRITADVLEGARCRIIACPVTGLDHIDEIACEAAGIQIISLRGETEFLKRVRATAELTLGLMLALLRHIPEAAASVNAGVWNRDLFRGRELFEKTAGVVGLGRLGTIVAEYLRALGMNVIGYDVRPDTPEWIERTHTLDELFARADVITLHVKYDESTHHLVDDVVLKAARPSAVIVNTSRGGVIDEEALLGALRTNRIAGAALDVIREEENFSNGNALLQYARENDDLLIVPHIGGNTEESFERTEAFLAKKVISALAPDSP